MQIAYDLIHGDTRLAIFGDSLQTQQHSAYFERWHPDRVTGIVNPSGFDTSYSFTSYSHPWLASSQSYTPLELTAYPQFAGTSLSRAIVATFADGVSGPDVGNTANTIASYHFKPFGQDDVAWYADNDGQLRIGLQSYNGPHAPTSGVIADVVVDGQTVATDILQTYDDEAYHQTHTLTIPTEGLDLSSSKVVLRLRMPGSVTLQSNQSVLFTGAHLTSDVSPGFQLGSVARGGIGLPYYTDRSIISDEAMGAYITGTQSNTALIWLGANDPRFAKAEWKAMMEDLIGRIESHKSDMDYMLVSSYDLGRDSDEYFTDALYEITESRDDTLFLNLFKVAGDYAYLDENYLTDGVHQGPDGAIYMADELWALIDEAAGEVIPEPVALPLMSLGAMTLLYRRRTGRC